MVIVGELLMIIGTILLIVASFLTHTVLGMIVAGFASISWGLFVLKIASMSIAQEGGGDKK